jgi:hypothetical protein
VTKSYQYEFTYTLEYYIQHSALYGQLNLFHTHSYLTNYDNYNGTSTQGSYKDVGGWMWQLNTNTLQYTLSSQPRADWTTTALPTEGVVSTRQELYLMVQPYVEAQVSELIANVVQYNGYTAEFKITNISFS